MLRLERVGIDDDFFALGGHSLLATRLMSRIESTLRIALPVRTLFESSTVKALSERLREGSVPRAPLEPGARPGRVPLSYEQRQLWFLDRMKGSSAEYNLSEALRLEGELDREALERTMGTLVERHESLRTRFVEEDGEPWQVIDEAGAVVVAVEDLSGYREDERRERVRTAMRDGAGHRFDLSRGPLLRVGLLKLGEREYVLLRTTHHIVSDGWSQAVFNREFSLLYEAYRAGGENPLAPIEVQYADYALWQRRRMEGAGLRSSLEYWKGQLAGIPERLELPADRPRPAVQTFAAEACQRILTKEQTGALKKLSREQQATLYMTLLAGLGVVLGRWSGQEDVVVGSPVANRQEPRLEGLVGLLLNSLAMRVRVREERSFTDLLEEVRQTTLGAYQHQDVPFERVIEELSPERSLNRTPVFQVTLTLHNQPWERLELAGAVVEGLRPEELRVRFDLEVHVFERGEELGIYWVYNRDVYERARMEEMLRQYTRADMADGRVGGSGAGADPGMGRRSGRSGGRRDDRGAIRASGGEARGGAGGGVRSGRGELSGTERAGQPAGGISSAARGGNGNGGRSGAGALGGDGSGGGGDHQGGGDVRATGCGTADGASGADGAGNGGATRSNARQESGCPGVGGRSDCAGGGD
jgi:hypothetical protein